MLRASKAAEIAGVPSVTIVGSEFMKQAALISKGLGLPLAVAEYPGAPMLDGAEAIRAKVTDNLLPEIIRGLTSPLSERTDAAALSEPRAGAIVIKGTLSQVQNHFHRNMWSDGLPIIPPTRERVAAFLRFTTRDATESLGVLPQEGRKATIHSIAVNAVMAGCLPEYFPVALAALEAVTDPRFDLLGIQTTTNPVTPVLIINGPIRLALEINCGRGCMGPGFRANATIGRAVKLALLNIGLCHPGAISKSIHGMPGRFTFCFGELEEASPWDPLHVEMGYRAEESTVSVVGGQGTQNMCCGLTTPEGIVHMVADGMRYYGSNGYLRGSGAPLLVIGPGHAKIFHEAGWDKEIPPCSFWIRPTPIPTNRLSERTSAI